MPRAGAAAPKKGGKVGAGPKARNLAERFPEGTVVQDLCKRQWRLGPVIGQGGFGLIYLAGDLSVKHIDKNTADHVIKIEPKQNGPLFCEMYFYQRVAKLAEIQTFTKVHRLRYLSVPPFIATGSHVHNSQESRFLVMPRFGTDLQKLLVDGGGTFPASTAFAVGLRMMDALQFLHENEYVHADVKASNILTGFSKGAENLNEVYLVDYGLAYRYRVGADHKEYKEDPRKAHDGTIEFTSRDAHKGVSPSRRADLEILGYCMLQWLGGRLPWESHLNNPSQVASDKEKLMSKPDQLVSAVLHDTKAPAADCIRKYLDVVNKLSYADVPDYRAIKILLKQGMERCGQKDEWKLNFSVKKQKGGTTVSPAGSTPKKGRKRKSDADTPVANSSKKGRKRKSDADTPVADSSKKKQKGGATDSPAGSTPKKGRKRKSDADTPVANSSKKGRKRKSDADTPVADSSKKAKSSPKKAVTSPKRARSKTPPSFDKEDSDEEDDFTSPRAKTGKRAPAKKPKATTKAAAVRKPRVPKAEPPSPTKKLNAVLAKKALRRASLGTGLKPARSSQKPVFSKVVVPPGSSDSSSESDLPAGSVISKRTPLQRGKAKAPARKPTNQKAKAITRSPVNGNGASPKSPRKGFSSLAKLPATKASKSSPKVKAVTKRKVRRVYAIQSDASIQTSPGLLNNR